MTTWHPFKPFLHWDIFSFRHRKTKPRGSVQLIFAANWQSSIHNAFHLQLRLSQLFIFIWCLLVCRHGEDIRCSRPNNVKAYFSWGFWFALAVSPIHHDKQYTKKCIFCSEWWCFPITVRAGRSQCQEDADRKRGNKSALYLHLNRAFISRLFTK